MNKPRESVTIAEAFAITVQLLKSSQEENLLYKEGNDFYANLENWRKQNQTSQTIISAHDVEYSRIPHNSFYLKYGGKRARQIKKAIEELRSASGL